MNTFIPLYKHFIFHETLSNAHEFDDTLFVKEVATRYETKYVNFVQSLASSVHVSLKTLHIKRGDSVAISVISPLAVSQSIRYFDATPVFCDVKPDSLMLDVECLKAEQAKLKNKIKILIVENPQYDLYEYERIYQFAKENNILVITLTSLPQLIDFPYDLAIFDLNQGYKNPIANLGIILSSTAEQHQYISLLINQGKVFTHGSYDVLELGYDYYPNNFSLAYYKSIFDANHEFNLRRESIAKYYFRAFEDLGIADFVFTKQTQKSYFHFFLSINKSRDQVINRLFKKGVGLSFGQIPSNMLTYYKQKYNLKLTQYPNALNHYQKLLSIPIYPQLTPKEIEYIAKEILIETK